MYLHVYFEQTVCASGRLELSESDNPLIVNTVGVPVLREFSDE